MTDLTEQLKKGELPEREYYIQNKEGNTSTMHLWNDERCKLSVRCKCLSILAPVPSYEEFLTLQSDSLAKNEATEIIAELESENTKLKELLKTIKHQCELLLPKNGLAPVGDRERLCKTFFNLIDEVLK